MMLTAGQRGRQGIRSRWLIPGCPPSGPWIWCLTRRSTVATICWHGPLIREQTCHGLSSTARWPGGGASLRR